jgi:amidase
LLLAALSSDAQPPPAALTTGLKLGVDLPYVRAHIDPLIFEHFERLLAYLSTVSTLRVTSVALPIRPEDNDRICEIWRHCVSREALLVHQQWYPARRDEYGPFGTLLDEGAALTDAVYQRDCAEREELRHALHQLLRDHAPILLLPTLNCRIPLVDEWGNPVASDSNGRSRFTKLFSLTNLACVSLPLADEVSVQLVGQDDTLLLWLAQFIERWIQSDHSRS